MLIEITSGNEIFKEVSAKTYTFFVPTTKYPGTEVHIGTLATVKNKENNPHEVKRLAKPVITTANSMLNVEMGGCWSSGVIDIPEDMILKIFMQRSLGYGQQRIHANMLVRVREYAAHRRIGVITTRHAYATNRNVYIEGRFDILSLEEARQLGAHIPKHLEYPYEESQVKKGFTQEIIYPEISGAPVTKTTVVVNSKGEEVEVNLTRKARVLKL